MAYCQSSYVLCKSQALRTNTAAKVKKPLVAVNILVIVLSHHLPEHKHLVVLAPVACFFIGNSWSVLY